MADPEIARLLAGVAGSVPENNPQKVGMLQVLVVFSGKGVYDSIKRSAASVKGII